ncbi:MAG: hypothetical protein CFH10_00439 [Alphaproteobacteria bacterium MarineAlpha4_Bin2]|nr:MAG: hypothetical protein CFH10_00439 [Alphaproteobacteria bacterium MarineAlpha4_Bin2]|tara:strand:- start:30 stop:362 length:333 start_codon:yes stop_codon:yes gene_type:complete
MAKGYIIGLIKITDREQFIETFAKKIGSFLESNGGKIITRTSKTLAHEGHSHDLNVIVEFEDYEQAKKMIGTTEWKELQMNRRKHSDPNAGSFMLLEEGDEVQASLASRG